MQNNIPNTFHLIYFGGRDFHLINYLAIRSIVKVNKPDNIFFYTDQKLSGEWWDKSLPYLDVIEYDAPKEINGVTLVHPAHQADVARLQILFKKGGIYLDLDVICRKPFSPLLNYPVVLGEEVVESKKVGICSAVILAQPNSLFIERWLDGFNPDVSLWRGFRSQGFDKYYSEMTTKYGNFLSMLYPEEVHVEPYPSFFYPNYSQNELSDFFSENCNSSKFEDSFCHHLWSNAAWDEYIENITEESIKQSNSPFAHLAKPYLE